MHDNLIREREGGRLPLEVRLGSQVDIVTQMTKWTRNINLTLNIGLRVSGLSFGFSGSPCFQVSNQFCGMFLWFISFCLPFILFARTDGKPNVQVTHRQMCVIFLRGTPYKSVFFRSILEFCQSFLQKKTWFQQKNKQTAHTKKPLFFSGVVVQFFRKNHIMRKITPLGSMVTSSVFTYEFTIKINEKGWHKNPSHGSYGWKTLED